jgi:phosphoglycolate phosphatase
MNFVLAAHGLPTYLPADYRRRIGEGVEQLARSVLPREARALVPQVIAEYRERYDSHLIVASAPYPGVRELLRELNARGTPSCVLSNKPDPATRTIIGELFPGAAFRSVVGERPDKPRKPDPTVALELARHMQVAPARCAFVGDTRIDMQTAVAAGMLPVGVQWGFQDAGELSTHGARALIARPGALLDLVANAAGD